MPIPKPKPKEEQSEFISRCISSIHGEYSAEGQAAAICHQAWRDKDKNMDLSSIITSSKSKLSGILTADRYFRGIQGCFGDGFCPTKLFSSGTPEQWAKELQAAESRLVYCDDEMGVKDYAYEGMALTPGAIMDFDAILTSTRKDRDGDILESSGVEVDSKMPLLWQHIPLQPIGKLVAVTSKSAQNIQGRLAIADTELGRDAAVLVEMGALRISHGFEPVDFVPLKKEGRWHIKKLNMLEVSLVSIPSNVDAVITAFSRQKLHAPLIKGWAQKQFDSRLVQGKGIDLPTKKDACTCGTKEKVVGKAHMLVTAEVDVRPVLHDPTDPQRWNPKLSKHFDTNLEYLQPSKLEYEWVSRFIGCEVKDIFQNEFSVPAARMGSWLSGLRHTVADSVIEDTRNITYDGKENPPVYEVIQLNSKQNQDFLVDGIQFYKSPEGRFVINVQPYWAGLRVIVYTDFKHREKNAKIVQKTWEWAIENNFLKGEAFSLSGDFLPRNGDTFEDVFLTEKNEQPLRRVLKQINEKGKQCPNRGMIMMGPPGTGKTLSGRIIKNEAKSTFIWISARDFWHMGSFGGITYAFDMAKELAPCVLFFEDVDNWIQRGSSSIDLLKTEMDGIGRSSGVITILTTNFPEQLPEALIDRPGRFHDVLKFDLPSVSERRRMLSKWLPDVELSVELMERTEGLSGAHLYELAAFAKTIKEQDEIGLGAAVVKALDKIAEQRELINESQLSGSNYRPRKELVLRTFAKSVKGRRKVLENKTFLVCDCGNVGTPDEFCKGEGAMYQCPLCGEKGDAEHFKPGKPSAVSFEYAAHKCVAEASLNEATARRLHSRLGWILKNIESEREAQEFESLLAGV